MATANKRHHQVPKFYLDRFASSGKVMVRWRDGRQATPNPLNVAVESGFYDIPDGAGGVSKEIETGLADIEGKTEAVLSGIDRRGRLPDPTSRENVTLALFVGLQMARTTDHRERVLFPRRVIDWANGRDVTHEVVAEYLETQHLGFKPRAAEVDGAWTVVRVAMLDEPHTLNDEFAVEMMLRSAIELSRRVLRLNWSIELDPRGAFITSDAPVLVWRKPTPRDHFEGFGIENADELRFPLDPGKQLVLSRRVRSRSVVRVAVHRVSRCNEDMAGACHRFIIGTPANSRPLARQRLDRWRPVIRFNVAPLLDEGSDGRMAPKGGDVVHMWTPRSARVGRPSAMTGSRNGPPGQEAG